MTDRESIRDAALQAEYETGIHESTERAAKAHVAVRLVRMTIGTCVTLLGIVLMPLPGPGLPVVAAGLAILARDVAWADRLLGHVRDRIPTNDDGRISQPVLATMIVSASAAAAFSVWWFVVR